MNRHYVKRLRVCLALALACPLITAAQSFSDRPIRFVTPSPVAGSLDALARIVAENQTVVPVCLNFRST